MVNKLTYGGIQITFGIQASTPVINAPKKNLILVGPCYYVVDVFDSSGAFDVDALLTGPASMIGDAAMESPGGLGGSIFVNGVETVIAFAAGTWSIGQVVSKLNEDVDGLVAFAVGTKLGLKTVRAGQSATLKVTGAIAAPLGFTAGDTVYGYGSYTGQMIEAPFSTLPDPRSILSQSVLDESSISVYANVAGSTFHFNEDTAFERNGYYCPSGKVLHTSGGASAVVGGFSPFLWRATTLRPWSPSAGFVSKFWAPGEDAVGYLPADPTDADNVIVMKAKGARNGVGGAFKNSDIGDYHGTAGNALYAVITVGPGAGTVTVTVVGNAINIVIAGTVTLDDVITAIEEHATASLMLDVDLIDGADGTTEVATWDGSLRMYLGGAHNPLSFAGADGATEPGGEFSVMGDRLTGCTMLTGDYIDLGVEGGPRTRVTFQAGDDLDDVIDTINAAFSHDIADKGGPGDVALVLTGPTTDIDMLGFKSSLAIFGSNCLSRLFIKDTQESIATEEGTCTSFAVVSAADVVGGIVEGDTIRVHGTSNTAVVQKIYAAGGKLYLYFSEPTSAFLPDVGEGPEYKDIDVISQLAATDFTSHRHHGAPYMTQQNDRLWAQGAVKSTVLTSNNPVTTSGDVPAAQQTFTYAALELGDQYGLSQTFPYWYVEARGCEDSDGATKPFPSIVIDGTDDLITLYGDSIVDSYGRSRVTEAYSLYAGYTALRQDISPRYSKDRTKISGAADLIDKLDPIAPLENPLGYAAYLAMLASGALYEFYVLGVPTDDVAGYLECIPVLRKYPDWCVVPVTSDNVVGQVFGSFISTMSAPDKRREVVALLAANIPDEASPTTLGSGAGCLTNEEGAETTLIFDGALFSLTAVLVAGGIDPETLTASDGVYVQISGGGASDAEALRRYLLSSVDSDQNTAVVKLSFGAGENDDAFYSTETPPVVSEADVSMYQRGDEITEPDDQLEALQALAETYSSRRICLIPSDGVDVDHNGVTTRVANYYAAAAVGGYTLAHKVEFPYSGYTIPGLLHVYGTDDTFEDLDKVTGLFFLQNGVAADTVEVCKQFTTDTSDVKKSEFSITSQLDSLALRVRDVLRAWRKKNTGDETLGEQNTLVTAACEACVTAREIKTAKVTDLSNHATLINVHNIVLSADPFIPLGGVFVYIIA